MKVKEDPDSKPIRDSYKWYGKCWNWTGSLLQSGYGRFYINSQCFRAHRVSYYLYTGSVSKEKLICHRCDNPRCVNPLHLFEGTAKDNSTDMKIKGRGSKGRKSKLSSSKYYGVFLRKEKKTKIWRCVLSHNYKQYRLGEFENAEEAAKVYDDEIKRRGFDKPLNFPD